MSKYDGFLDPLARVCILNSFATRAWPFLATGWFPENERHSFYWLTFRATTDLSQVRVGANCLNVLISSTCSGFIVRSTLGWKSRWAPAYFFPVALMPVMPT